MKFRVPEEYHNQRADFFLKNCAGEDLSRSQVQKWIESGWVRNATTQTLLKKTGEKLQSGDELELNIPEPPEGISLEPIPMHFPVLWEDEEMAIIHKPPGLASHPGPGEDAASVVHGLLAQFPKLSRFGGGERPGLVHRLDKLTEGVLVIAKTDRAHATLGKLFQERKVEKQYFAWVLQALPESSGTIDLPITRHPVERIKMVVSENGRRAVTHYKVHEIITTQRGRKFSLVELGLETGRTHQIRVHLQKLQCPIVGDPLYSKSWKSYENFGLLLVARQISLEHPFTGKRISVSIDFPERFLSFQRKCKSY